MLKKRKTPITELWPERENLRTYKVGTDKNKPKQKPPKKGGQYHSQVEKETLKKG